MSRRFWFTADLHLDHRAIIDYSSRPWRLADGQPDMRAMQAALLGNIRACVEPDDTLFLQGDVFLGNKKRIMDVLGEFGPIPGRVILIPGNHDRCTNGFYRSLGWEVHAEPFRVGDLVLLHHPPEEEDAPPRRRPRIRPMPGQTYLCGHVHERWAERRLKPSGNGPFAHVINVGVDVRDYRPVQLKDLGLSDSMLGPTMPGCTCLKSDPCQECTR